MTFWETFQTLHAPIDFSNFLAHPYQTVFRWQYTRICPWWLIVNNFKTFAVFSMKFHDFHVNLLESWKNPLEMVSSHYCKNSIFNFMYYYYYHYYYNCHSYIISQFLGGTYSLFLPRWKLQKFVASTGLTKVLWTATLQGIWKDIPPRLVKGFLFVNTG